MRMNKKEEFKKIVNFYLIIKNFNKDSEEYKSAYEILKTGSPYTCCSCNNKSGLSFIEPKHICSFPMFNKNHIPYEEYLIRKCDEYGWSWRKVEDCFRKLVLKKSKE